MLFLDFSPEEIVSSEIENDLLAELKIMSCLGSHANILNLFGACTAKGASGELPYGFKHLMRYDFSSRSWEPQREVNQGKGGEKFRANLLLYFWCPHQIFLVQQSRGRMMNYWRKHPPIVSLRMNLSFQNSSRQLNNYKGLPVCYSEAAFPTIWAPNNHKMLSEEDLNPALGPSPFARNHHIEHYTF